MISVRCLGHIKSSVGAETVEIDADDIEAGELVDRVRAVSKDDHPGFNRYNTLAMVDEGEAFLPAASARRIKGGEKVVLIPFSHGG